MYQNYVAYTRDTVLITGNFPFWMSRGKFLSPTNGALMSQMSAAPNPVLSWYNPQASPEKPAYPIISKESLCLLSFLS